MDRPRAAELVLADDLRRPRMYVLARPLFVIPHLVVLLLWDPLARAAVLGGWLVALVTGRMPARLGAYLARYLRYRVRVAAYASVLAGPYPLFPPGNRPQAVDAHIEPQRRQRRLVTLFRVFLALPAVVLAGCFGVVLAANGVASWLVALALGRLPKGMRDLGAYCLRYKLELWAYLFVLTAQYPTLESDPALYEPPRSS